ncbi:CDP-alcohol phosphatidyltransferase [Pseudopedobacter saltans DSM 12145]|uniref:CDP-diacylglycerol--serine O-phosphatidyltransferase n=1 Tax=Pseudopedobacter saltans (strain ATCC 51119 / DSM 12145 / JCM 21818 / CCUG 39354 / LMG 10337 / NBRC 100064 / NCIMB 13643) TaxID=762903 RepID=F0SB18_PSESL|nr:CDP-diacylglycerol--serine O-phosphatidyltransferase [Pseudopedobacter saltans]ADY52653.1 CDP-alcohol phosphatidyltransferase [Pseudopedobacter saltans DSM 12145]
MIKKHIPNLLTSANLFSGCVGAMYAFQGDLKTVAYFVILSGIFDFFDGFAARLLNVKSEIGKELDSLADVISFGFVPGIIFFQLLKIENPDNFLPYFGFIITVFSGLRLAKFNIDTRQTEDFIGLNTPMNTFFVISLPYILDSSPFITNTWLLYGLIIGLSLLLVSELRLFSMKLGKDLSWKTNKYKYLFLIFSLISIVTGGFSGLPFVLLLYIAFSLLHFKQKNELIA